MSNRILPKAFGTAITSCYLNCNTIRATGRVLEAMADLFHFIAFHGIFSAIIKNIIYMANRITTDITAVDKTELIVTEALTFIRNSLEINRWLGRNPDSFLILTSFTISHSETEFNHFEAGCSKNKRGVT